MILITKYVYTNEFKNQIKMNDKDRIRPIPAGLFRDVDGDAILRASKDVKLQMKQFLLQLN